MEDSEINRNLHILHFMLQDISVCIDLNIVNKILPLIFIEKIPKSPNYVVGIMNIAGKSVFVIDLALRLGLERKNTYSLDIPIILCTQGSHLIGIIVDKIIGIEKVEQNILQMGEDFQSEKSPVKGVIKIKDNLILALNMSIILEINMTLDKDKTNIAKQLINMTDH